jgi:hypothetical protein
MILVDTNLLLYAAAHELPQHDAARTWLDRQLNGEGGVALPWESILGFLRVSTNPRLFRRPPSLAAAWKQVREWLAVPGVWTPQPAENHEAVLGRLLAGERRTDLVHDAHLAALAIEHGLILCSTDRDFSRFEGLRWENPLAG